jgi:aminoglycoside phosphotransferase (APT) family kinase protein
MTMLDGLHQEAFDLARNIFGSELAGVEQIKRGVMTYKFIASLHIGTRYVIRFYPETRANVVRSEPDLIRRCAAAGLMVPQILTDSRSGPKARLQYCIYKWIDGVLLEDSLPSLDDLTLNAVAAELVEHLERLQTITVTGYGELVEANTACFATWQSFVSRTFTEGFQGAARAGLWPDGMRADMETVLRYAMSRPSVGPPVLTWGDVSPEHILLDSSNHIIGLLDFESGMAAEFLLNLGYCYARYGGTRFFEAFHHAWKPPTDEEQKARVSLYVVLRAMRIAKFADMPLPTNHPRMSIIQLLPGLRPAINHLVRVSR